MLTFLLVDLQTRFRGQNGVEFYQEFTGHVGFFLALGWPMREWKLLLLFDLQISMRGQNGVEFYQESTGHVGFFLALLLADQWEAENPNFFVIWLTDKYEG